MKIAIIGGGQTGRGFLARLFHEQADILFIDSDRGLVENLRGAGGFAVRYFDGREPTHITGYEVCWTGEPVPGLRGCDVIFVCVRAENTAAAGDWLADKIRPDAAVIACENAARPSALFTGALKDRAGSGAVFCTSVNAGIDILSENYPVLYTDSKIGAAASLTGIEVAPDFDVLMERKIYTYNAASTIIAYLGAAKGYEVYAEAANDQEIAGLLDRFYDEINRAICAEYGTDAEEQRQFALLSKIKFQNRRIEDSVSRNAASPARKLSAAERIIHPARLILSHGGNAAVLAKTAAAALRYMGVSGMKEAQETLRNISSLREDEPLFVQIMDVFLGGK